jgi:hypothetical protein
MTDLDFLRLERTAGRAARLFGAAGAGGGHESSGARRGLPGEADRIAIARRLLVATAEGGTAMSEVQAAGVAEALVRAAGEGLEQLAGSASPVLTTRAAVALEAVIHVRGRPAVKVLGETLEDIRQYPESGMWKMLADMHEAELLAAVDATAAVRVSDPLLPGWDWVQGTAFLVSETMALTNRHVLFPPAGGTRLARRVPGTTTATLKRSYDVQLDFAFDSGAPRQIRYRVVDIPFVAEDSDPVDAALLKVERLAGTAPAALPISKEDFDADRLYLVGHPGILASVPEEVLAVFGTPDERKRVSFGMVMEGDDARERDVLHDASTIGGYSGAAVLGFASPEVRALHYWGDPVRGNRAVPAAALRAHPVLGAML